MIPLVLSVWNRHQAQRHASGTISILSIARQIKANREEQVQGHTLACFTELQMIFCLQDIRPELLQISVDKSSVVPLYLPEDGPQQLVWIQESTIDNSFRTPEYEAEVADFIDWQTILFEGEKSATASLVYRTANSGVVAVADQGAAHILSTRLPRFWKALPIPASPVSYLPVPETAIERVQHAAPGLRYISLTLNYSRYDAKTESSYTVLISGPYYSRGSFSLEQAPGGNDDGSDTISFLNIARRRKRTGITFGANVELVPFAGEEQGLLGSKAYYLFSKQHRHPGSDTACRQDFRVSLVESPSMNRVTLQLTSSNVRVQVRLIHNNSLYGLTTVLPVADPMYHNSGDLSDRPGYDLNQVRSICKVQFRSSEGVHWEDLEEL
ncbi:hypothetical protein EDC04DRAFT_3098408 [Pisolithus marmoratus]|nr:hypothetical protein EDC04DRAFT_3098408 [Pisolithus marmoratus]